MKSSLIFKPDLKTYSVSSLDSLSSNAEGIQEQIRTTKSIDLAIYNKGSKVVKKLNEDSYTVSIIEIYSEPHLLSLLDEVTYNNKIYVVLEDNSTPNHQDYSVYKATSNV